MYANNGGKDNSPPDSGSQSRVPVPAGVVRPRRLLQGVEERIWMICIEYT